MEEKKVPVLFLIFKRKDTALMAFNSIKKYQPKRLYIAADGPRSSVDGEIDDCKATREAILETIDWECNIKTLFRDENLGCTGAVNSGISWFFEHEDYGVIIEDDIVLSIDFLKMCEVLLPRYEKDSQVMAISSRNHSGKCEESDEYCFVNSLHIWGWATWRRAWALNPQDFAGWKEYHKRQLIKRYGLFEGLMSIYYYNMCSNPHSGFFSWDYAWTFHIAKYDGIVIIPKVNLSSNVGIGVAGSANYKEDDKDPYEHLKVGRIKWPIKMRDKICLDIDQIRSDQEDFFRIRMIGLQKKIKRLFK